MRYIEIVGVDGAGKSSLCRALKWKLGDRAYVMHVPSRDLSTSEVVRYVSRQSVSPVPRVLTYMAAYSEAYDIFQSANHTCIDYLIGDRGYACLSVYHEASAEVIDELWAIAMRGLFPDLLVFIDTPVSMCRDRISRRRKTSDQDTRPVAYHEAVRERYVSFVKAYAKRGMTLTLDGTRHKNVQLHSVWKMIREFRPMLQ